MELYRLKPIKNIIGANEIYMEFQRNPQLRTDYSMAKLGNDEQNVLAEFLEQQKELYGFESKMTGMFIYEVLSAENIMPKVTNEIMSNILGAIEKNSQIIHAWERVLGNHDKSITNLTINFANNFSYENDAVFKNNLETGIITSYSLFQQSHINTRGEKEELALLEIVNGPGYEATEETVVKKLEKELNEVIRNEEYERAAEIRDKIKELENVSP